MLDKVKRTNLILNFDVVGSTNVVIGSGSIAIGSEPVIIEFRSDVVIQICCWDYYHWFQICCCWIQISLYWIWIC